MNDLATVAEAFKDVDKLRNFSNTGRANWLNKLFQVGAGFGGGATVGAPTTGAAITVLGPYISTKILTSPRLVKWLLDTAKETAGQTSARAYGRSTVDTSLGALNRLIAIRQNTKDREERDAATALLDSLSEAEGVEGFEKLGE